MSAQSNREKLASTVERLQLAYDRALEDRAREFDCEVDNPWSHPDPHHRRPLHPLGRPHSFGPGTDCPLPGRTGAVMTGSTTASLLIGFGIIAAALLIAGHWLGQAFGGWLKHRDDERLARHLDQAEAERERFHSDPDFAVTHLRELAGRDPQLRELAEEMIGNIERDPDRWRAAGLRWNSNKLTSTPKEH